MSPTEYLAALCAVGIAKGLPVHDLDRQAARLLNVDERTARRYRRGEVGIPGPVKAALECFAAARARADSKPT